MYLDTLKLSATVHSGSRSRAKFYGDFRAELSKTLAELEIALRNEITQNFTLDSLDVGNNDIKMRIRDESVGSEKIISAIFRFHHDDEKYGNVHIEIQVCELSRKNRSEFLGKYLVTNRKIIIPAVCKSVVEGINAH